MLDKRIPDWATVPEALRKREQWVCWRAVDAGDSADGISLTPIDPATGERATFDDETTWGSFEDVYTASTAYEMDVDGVAFYPTRRTHSPLSNLPPVATPRPVTSMTGPRQ